MISKNRLILTPLMTAVLALALMAPAFAGGPGGPHEGGMHGIPPNRPGFPVGILRELIYPCPAGCNDIAKSCNDTADTAALACVSDTCPTEITTAQTACAADSHSTDCITATTALKTCATDCLTTRSTASAACLTALRTCVGACESAN